MKQTLTYSDWSARAPINIRARNIFRNAIVRGLAVGRRIDRTSDWIRFPYYHHVFEDERQNFYRHLKYLQGVGEFISMDDAVSLIASGNVIDGRYFCLNFDDGLKCCLTGAMPILSELDIPAIFYVVTGVIGKSFEPDDPVARNVFGFRGRDTTLDFLSWDDCLKMSAAGMIIGSHTVTHPKLSDLADNLTRAEFKNSKSQIEQNIGEACNHFCAPYGNPDSDFDVTHHGNLAKSAGYLSFVTGRRGSTRSGDDPFALKRDQLIAKWELYQLRYFLSLR